MSTLFKDIYNSHFFSQLIAQINHIEPDFDSQRFLDTIYDTDWEQRELKARIRHISQALGTHLKGDYTQQLETILKVVGQIQQSDFDYQNIEFLIFPDFVEVFGLEHFEASVAAMEQITQLESCEFAVRPFIKAYPEKMDAQMQLWSQHKHPQVRRLSTEGYRPRLPWGMGIPFLKKDPTPVLSILKQLKQDPAETVRRSVANNLNDISKDHPETVIALAKQWKGQTTELDWVVKHACRTLLKQGHPEVMQLFGFGDISQIVISKFTIDTPEVALGDYLVFHFELANTAKKASLIRLEYAIYFVKANGSLSKKVFKISEKTYAADSRTSIERKQAFKKITTRQLYAGTHKVALIINGQEQKSYAFEFLN
jgi:3-methyladenine DNA glycosylase AlkC